MSNPSPSPITHGLYTVNHSREKAVYTPSFFVCQYTPQPLPNLIFNSPKLGGILFLALTGFTKGPRVCEPKPSSAICALWGGISVSSTSSKETLLPKRKTVEGLVVPSGPSVCCHSGRLEREPGRQRHHTGLRECLFLTRSPPGPQEIPS